MDNWVEYKISKLVEMEVLDPPKDGNHGDIHPKAKDFVANGIPFIMASDIKDGHIDLDGCKFITKNQADNLQKGFAREGDVLLTHKATIGRTAVIKSLDFPYLMLTPQVTYYRVRDKSKLDRDFLKYYFDFPPFQKMLGLWAGAGSTRAYLGITGQVHLKVRLPNITTQRRIARLLTTIDKKIELNNRINAELETMAKTLYDYWFVQFDFPDANGNPYKTSGGKMVYNETLKREIPEGWSSNALGHLIAKAPTVPKLKKTDYGASGKIPIIDQSADFICGFTNEDKFTISPIKAHVVFGDHTRIVKLVNFDYARGADGTQILISKSNNISDYLLYQIVNSIDLSNYGYARHFKFLKSIEVVEPDCNISEKYEQVVEPVFEKIKSGIFENIQLAKLRDWLLPMLMNGQVTVK